MGVQVYIDAEGFKEKLGLELKNEEVEGYTLEGIIKEVYNLRPSTPEKAELKDYITKNFNDSDLIPKIRFCDVEGNLLIGEDGHFLESSDLREKIKKYVREEGDEKYVHMRLRFVPRGGYLNF